MILSLSEHSVMKLPFLVIKEALILIVCTRSASRETTVPRSRLLRLNSISTGLADKAFNAGMKYCSDFLSCFLFVFLCVVVVGPELEIRALNCFLTYSPRSPPVCFFSLLFVVL